MQSIALRPTLQPPTAKTTDFEPMSCLIFARRTRRNLGELDQNLAKISDTRTPEREHWRGFAARSVVGLLIRRSLVRAQVGEPPFMKARGQRPVAGFCVVWPESAPIEGHWDRYWVGIAAFTAFAAFGVARRR